MGEKKKNWDKPKSPGTDFQEQFDSGIKLENVGIQSSTLLPQSYFCPVVASGPWQLQAINTTPTSYRRKTHFSSTSSNKNPRIKS